MKYVALLRGINVGGNSMIKMSALQEAVKNAGFQNVKTYIQSGNVIFDSDEKKSGKVREILERILSKTFSLNLRIVIRSDSQLKKIIDEAPDNWKKKNDLRCYLAFIREPVTADDVLKEIETNDGVDSVKTGHGVLYLSTKLSGITKSRFSKLSSKKIYRDITIRNYNTTLKILSLIELDL